MGSSTCGSASSCGIRGDLQGAIDQFTWRPTLQPDYSDAWRERGIQEARVSKNARGEEALRKAIALNPSDFDALASLGGILRKTDRLDEAGAVLPARRSTSRVDIPIRC